MLDVDTFLKPRAPDAPSGEDLEYDQAFQELELAAKPGEERQVGKSIIAAEDPDWKDMARKATAVLERSHDLRAAVYLAHAALRDKGVAEFAKVIAYIRGCLETHWDTCYPRLDEDDGDPTMRVNTLLGLTDGDTIVRALRLAPITNSRVMGRFSYRDVQIVTGELAKPPEMEKAPEDPAIRAAFADTDDEWRTALRTAIAQADSDVRAMSKLLDEKLVTEAPNLDLLKKTLIAIRKRLNDMAGDDGPGAEGEAAPAAEGADESGAGGGGGGAATVVVAAPGTIASRQDVVKAIDRIIEYYTKNEPTSPLPLLLQRARRLVDADFLTILKDMAPDGVKQVQVIGGVEPEPEAKPAKK